MRKLSAEEQRANLLPELVPAPGCTTIEEVRAAIDLIDERVVALLGLRFEYVKSIVRFKSTQEDVHAKERYRAVLAQRRRWAEQHGLSPDVIEQVYRELLGYFIAEELRKIGHTGADEGADD